MLRTHEQDTNAIEVHIPLLGQRVGYISAEAAEHLAPSIDLGERDDVVDFVTAVTFAPGRTDNPGIRIGSIRVTELRKGIPPAIDTPKRD